MAGADRQGPRRLVLPALHRASLPRRSSWRTPDPAGVPGPRGRPGDLRLGRPRRDPDRGPDRPGAGAGLPLAARPGLVLVGARADPGRGAHARALAGSPRAGPA